HAPAEALQVGEAGMGADRHAVLLAELHRVDHHRRMAGMEAAGDVGRLQDLQPLGVIAHHPRAEALAQVGVDVDESGIGRGHWKKLLRLSPRAERGAYRKQERSLAALGMTMKNDRSSKDQRSLARLGTTSYPSRCERTVPVLRRHRLLRRIRQRDLP